MGRLRLVLRLRLRLIPGTDMVDTDTAVDTMEDTAEDTTVDTTTARGRLRLIPGTDTAMVDTAMVDTAVDTTVDTDTVDTVDTVDTTTVRTLLHLPPSALVTLCPARASHTSCSLHHLTAAYVVQSQRSEPVSS